VKLDPEFAIEVRDLEKMYDSGRVQTHALRGISMGVEPGEFAAVAGPSGSGKTTLLNLVGCLDVPSAGKVFVSGTDTSLLSPSERAELRLRRIGFVFQAFNLIPVLTALENVEFVMLLQKVDPSVRREKSLAILREVGLEEYSDRRPNELSGGQQQRVAVARAIVSEPAIVLADEPTANLDSTTGSSLLDLMERLNQKHGTTFLFSTHDRMVMERAHRLIRLRDGILADDSPSFHPPASESRRPAQEK
jgi:putative ABC transport system ATP-binding protein